MRCELERLDSSQIKINAIDGVKFPTTSQFIAERRKRQAQKQAAKPAVK